MNMVGRYFEEGWEVARDAGAPSSGIGARPKGATSARSTTWAPAAPRRPGRRGRRLAGSAVRRGTQDFLMAIHAGMLRSDHQVIRVLGALAEARLHSRSSASLQA